MAVLSLYFKIIFLFYVVKCEETREQQNTNTTCVNSFKNIESKPINVTAFCKSKPCMPKCCPEGEILYENADNETSEFNTEKCVRISEVEAEIKEPLNLDGVNIDIYKSNMEKTNLILEDKYQYVLNNKLWSSNCSDVFSIELKKPFYLLESSTVVVENPHRYVRFNPFQFENFCLDRKVLYLNNEKKTLIEIRIVANEQGNEEENIMKEEYYAAAMLVSFVFLLLVLFVYCALHELRNLAGMIQMTYVASLAFTFLLKAIEKLNDFKTYQLKPLSIILYFLILSTFCWMSVMSWDIWWNFRGMFYSRRINRQGILVKYGWYGLYSWGLPLIATIVAVAIDESELESHPEILKPFFENGSVMTDSQVELKFFLYIPCLVLIILNWLFFLMTAFNIWRIKRSMNQFSNDDTKYNQNQNRFGLYLKLSLVMGISWLLEVIDLPSWLDTVGGVYNTLTGVAIFFVFVFKKKILLMLIKRFKLKGKTVDRLQRKLSKYSTTTAASAADRKRSAAEIEATPSEQTASTA